MPRAVFSMIHGGPWDDDLRDPRGMIFIKRNGLRWRDMSKQ